MRKMSWRVDERENGCQNVRWKAKREENIIKFDNLFLSKKM